MSEKTINHLFDYGSINDDHKSAASEIASIVEQSGNEMLAELIKVKFQIKEIPKYDLKQSKMVQACAEAGIYCAVQGLIQEGVDSEAIQYPMVTICEDVRKLETLYDLIKKHQ